MFELKKILSALLMPLPALLLVAFVGLMLVMFTTKRKTGSLLSLSALVLLFMASFQPISSRLLMPIEREYKAFLPVEQTIDYVMVLGNGHVVDDEIPPTSEISRTALMRLAEGIRIMRMYPGAKLILSGYSGGTQVSHARMLAKVALALGVAKSDIVLLETARDTWEEAQQAALFVQNKSLVLVTSASHMKRAMQEFTNAGLNPFPAPTNYLANRSNEQAWDAYTPKSLYLEQTELYWHEKLGIWWRTLLNWASSQNKQAQSDLVAINE